MSKEQTNGGDSPKGPLETTPQDKAKAVQWFDRGKKVAETHNYDYAIECYTNGLAIWPEAVDEGHKPLRAVSYARLGVGGKKPGMLEKMKFSTGVARDPLQGMITAEKLLARDPTNLDYFEGMVRNAHKAGCEQTLLWIGPLFAEEPIVNPKPNQGRLAVIRQVFEDLGDRFNRRGEVPTAVACYNLGLKALESLHRAKSDDAAIINQLRDLSGKLTISKGKFEGGDFRDSLYDAEGQRNLRDKERIIADTDRLAQLVEEAKKELAKAPDEADNIFKVVEAILRQGRPKDEEEAITFLESAYAKSTSYVFKMRADDIRLRRLRRMAQGIAETGDKQAAIEHLRKQLDQEIEIFKDRIRHYPTESRHKYELGKRYFQGRRFDEAIPVLQQARNDPKCRTACGLLIAESFHHKGYQDQAIHLLEETIRQHELSGDDLSKELHYWLGRACEANNQKEAAANAYGQIIQWDYNYRDVRQRLEAVQQNHKSEGPT